MLTCKSPWGVVLGVLCAGLVAACSLPSTSAPKTPPLKGRVDFGAGVQTQTVIEDVGVAATVTLIDPRTNQSIASTVTAPDRSFSLSITGFFPAMQTYYLEAIKGSSSNTPGHDAIRLRTLVHWNGNLWSALTAGDASLGVATTAVSALVDLHQTRGPLDVDALMGSLTASGAAWGYTFTPGASGLDPTELAITETLVNNAILAERDPLDAIDWGVSAPVYRELPDYGVITSVAPNPCAPGGTLTVLGQNLSAGATVTLAGLPVSVTGTVAGGLVLLLPSNAVSGQLAVGVATASVLVVPGFSGGVNLEGGASQSAGTAINGSFSGR